MLKFTSETFNTDEKESLKKIEDVFFAISIILKEKSSFYIDGLGTIETKLISHVNYINRIKDKYCKITFFENENRSDYSSETLISEYNFDRETLDIIFATLIKNINERKKYTIDNFGTFYFSNSVSFIPSMYLKYFINGFFNVTESIDSKHCVKDENEKNTIVEYMKMLENATNKARFEALSKKNLETAANHESKKSSLNNFGHEYISVYEKYMPKMEDDFARTNDKNDASVVGNNNNRSCNAEGFREGGEKTKEDNKRYFEERPEKEKEKTDNRSEITDDMRFMFKILNEDKKKRAQELKNKNNDLKEEYYFLQDEKKEQIPEENISYKKESIIEKEELKYTDRSNHPKKGLFDFGIKKWSVGQIRIRKRTKLMNYLLYFILIAGSIFGISFLIIKNTPYAKHNLLYFVEERIFGKKNKLYLKSVSGIARSHFVNESIVKYRTEKDGFFWDIAEDIYGDYSYWVLLYAFNENTYKNNFYVKKFSYIDIAEIGNDRMLGSLGLIEKGLAAALSEIYFSMYFFFWDSGKKSAALQMLLWSKIYDQNVFHDRSVEIPMKIYNDVNRVIPDEKSFLEKMKDFFCGAAN